MHLLMLGHNTIHKLANVIKPEHEQNSGSSSFFAGDRTEKHVKVHCENESAKVRLENSTGQMAQFFNT